MTYQSPYGKTEGIADRLREFAKRLGTDKTMLWHGLGPIEDINKAADLLDDGPRTKLPLGEARAEVFAELASKPSVPVLEYDL